MNIFLQYVRVFAAGGLLCLLAQILIDRTKLTPARILVAYVTAGVFLGAVGIYKPFTEFAGCGATTPISGFGYLIAEGVKKEVEAKGLLGALTGGLTASAGGITAALVSGLVCALVFRSKPKM